MAQIKEFISRIQLVRRPSQTATKVMVILALVLSMGALVTLRLSTNALKEENAALHDQAADLTAANEELKENIDQLGSVQSVEEIAREELGLVDADTVIFQPQTAESES